MLKALMILVTILLAGCSMRVTLVQFDMETDENGTSTLRIQANGSTLTDTTEQTTDGKVSAMLDKLLGTDTPVSAAADALDTLTGTPNI